MFIIGCRIPGAAAENREEYRVQALPDSLFSNYFLFICELFVNIQRIIKPKPCLEMSLYIEDILKGRSIPL